MNYLQPNPNRLNTETPSKSSHELRSLKHQSTTLSKQLQMKLQERMKVQKKLDSQENEKSLFFFKF